MTAAHGPRSGPGVHLSAEELSAAAEEAQPPAEGASEHLGSCATCRAELDSLKRLLAALETLERPAVPPEVALRIDAALTREAANWSGHPQGAQEAARSGARSSATRRLRPYRRLGFALAGLAVTAGGVLLGVNLVSSTTSGSAASASGNGAAMPEASLPDNAARRAGQLDASPQELPSAAPLVQWVRQTLAGLTPHTRINSPCLSDPAFSGGEPLAVVNGSYEGAPAVLVIYANRGNSSTVRAVAYALPCAAQNYQVLAQGIVAK